MSAMHERFPWWGPVAVVLCACAPGEVLAVVQTAMQGGLPYTALRDAIFTHPTMAEGLNVLLANVPSELEVP